MAYDAARDDALKVRLYQWASLVRQAAWEAYQIGGLVRANDVLTSAEFGQPRHGVDPADAGEVVQMIGDFVAFLQNGPVTAKDREAVMHRILGGPLS